MNRIDEITIREVDQRDPVEMACWREAQMASLPQMMEWQDEQIALLQATIRKAGGEP